MTLRPTEIIVCVDCGGVCHLLTKAGEDGWVIGEWVSYRCADCMDRWDVELTEDDQAQEPS